jgi:SAM-dependent methyltransferase
MKRFDKIKCWIKYKVFRVKRTSEQTQEFWNKAENDNWETYSTGIEKSEFLWNLLHIIPLTFNDRILELGCNIGRNLNHLQSKGYKTLVGVELNQEAIKARARIYPKLKATIYPYPIEMYFRLSTKNCELIFTMAVLEHLPEESEWVFAEMVKRTKYILTIEDEKSINKICFPRNYKKIFEDLGMEQIYECGCEGVHPTLTKNFRARIFKRG